MTKITVNEYIHCPASYYFNSGYVYTLAGRLESITSLYNIESICMNEETYNWIFRLFSSMPSTIKNPLSSDANNKYINFCPIIIKSNSVLNDGTIQFFIKEDL